MTLKGSINRINRSKKTFQIRYIEANVDGLLTVCKNDKADINATYFRLLCCSKEISV